MKFKQTAISCDPQLATPWISDYKRLDSIRNEIAREKIGLNFSVEKVAVSCLMWFDYMDRRVVKAVIKRVDQ